LVGNKANKKTKTKINVSANIHIVDTFVQLQEQKLTKTVCGVHLATSSLPVRVVATAPPWLFPRGTEYGYVLIVRLRQIFVHFSNGVLTGTMTVGQKRTSPL
jgi:hypothetical protein